MTSARRRGGGGGGGREGGGVSEKLTNVDIGGGGGGKVAYKVDINHDTSKGWEKRKAKCRTTIIEICTSFRWSKILTN